MPNFLRSENQEYLWAARERITIDDTAGGIGFTAAIFNPTTGDRKGIPARIAKFTVETADIRYTKDGSTAPTSAIGKTIYETGGDSIIGSLNIKNFRAFRIGANSATIDVEYGW